MAKKRSGSDGLHCFTILAFKLPRSEASAAGRSREGAYVNCWIDFKLGEGALVLAKHYVRKAGWRIRTVEEHQWFDGPSDVEPSSVRYFREAKRNGASFVFHRYPTRRRARQNTH